MMTNNGTSAVEPARDSLKDWIERLERNCATPPSWVQVSRLAEYREQLDGALRILRAQARMLGDGFLARNIVEFQWERVRDYMRFASACAFPNGANTETDEPVFVSLPSGHGAVSGVVARHGQTIMNRMRTGKPR